MARDLNKVTLIGRLGKDVDMRFTPQGKAVADFTLATGRQWGQGDDKKKETEWHSIVVWDKLAEICNQYLTKGSRIYIEGRLQTRSWDDVTSGEKKYKTEVIASDMIILDNRGDEQSAAPQRQAPVTRKQTISDEDVPF